MIRLPYSVAPLLLAGCASGSIAPGVLPKEATSGVYTVAEPQVLASCLAAQLGSTVQADGDRLVIASIRHPGVRYSIGANRGGGVYPTQIAVIGRDPEPEDTVEATMVNACIVANRRT